jgi:hypothetical protein
LDFLADNLLDDSCDLDVFRKGRFYHFFGLSAEVRHHRVEKLKYVLSLKFNELVRISSTSDASGVSLDVRVE